MSARHVWTRFQRFAALAAVAACLIGAGIPLSSYLVNQGTFTPLGQNDVAIPDSNYTLSATDYSGRAVRFTGALTADRNATVPLEKGISYEVTNATTGGHNVLFGGASGTRVTISPSTTQPVSVHCPDGANFYLMGGASGTAFDPANPGPIGGSDAGAVTATDLVVTSSETFSNAIGFANGTPRFFGNGSVVYSSDADKDISGIPNAYTSPVLEITATGGGLTAARNLTVPFGGPWWVLNRTTQTINVGGSSGARVGVPAGYAMSVVSNTGNFFGLLPINLANGAFVTGLLPASNGGTGLDAAAGVSGQTLISNGAGGYTLGDPIAGSLATNDVTDGGLGVIRFYSDQATMALDAGHEYKGAALGIVADASTWTELYEVTPPLPGSEIVTFDFFAADMADAPDGGAADAFGCVFKFILTRTNSGAVYYQPYPPNAAPVALDASTPPCNVGFGSQDGGVITSFPGSFQIVNRGGTVFLEWKSVPGQSPWKASNEVDARRRKP
jgi:hypothetical protein